MLSPREDCNFLSQQDINEDMGQIPFRSQSGNVNSETKKSQTYQILREMHNGSVHFISFFKWGAVVFEFTFPRFVPSFRFAQTNIYIRPRELYVIKSPLFLLLCYDERVSCTSFITSAGRVYHEGTARVQKGRSGRSGRRGPLTPHAEMQRGR